MAGVCTIVFDNPFTEEQKKSINKANKEGRTEKKSKGKFIDSLINTGKNFYKENFTVHAAYRDMINDISDPNRRKARLSADAKDVENAMSAMNGDKVMIETYKGFRASRRILNQIKHLGDDAIYETLEYKQWVSEGQSDKSIEAFKDHWQSAHDVAYDAISNNANALEAHQRMQNIYQRKIDILQKLNPEILSDLTDGNYTDPMSFADSIQSKLFLADKNDSIKEFYEKTMGINVDVAMNNPDHVDITLLNIIDAHTKSLILHNEIMKEHKNNELLESLKSLDTKEVNPEYIQSLDDDHKLKKTFNSSFTAITEDARSMNIFNNEVAKGKTEIEAVTSALENMAVSKMTDSNGWLNKDRVKQFIKNNKASYTELYKLTKGNIDSVDIEGVKEELKNINSVQGTNFVFSDASMGEFKYLMEGSKTIKKEVLKENAKNAGDISKIIASQFPGHTLVTTNGTIIMKEGLNFSQIENNKEVHGHIVDLSNPKLIVDDIIALKSIQENGNSGLIHNLIEGKIALIPTEKAETMAKYKKQATSRMSSWKLGNINKLYTMSTLFGPWNLPGYIIGTQIPGNIGHSLMADPAALKHWPKMAKYAMTAVKGDFHKIPDERIRNILRYITTSEGNGIHRMSAEDLGFVNDKKLFDDLGKAVETKDESIINKFFNTKIFKTGLKYTGYVEAISRASLAYEIMNKRDKGKTFVPATANKNRVEHLWDIDPHLAAVRLSNDAHIDYNNTPQWVKKIGRIMPFVSFKYGSLVNLSRQTINTYKAVKEAMNGSGDWKTARSYLGRGAVAVAWRAGVAALIWNTVMQATGLLSKDKRDQNQRYSSSNIFNQLFSKVGINLDNNFYVPGTGVNIIDKALRLNKASQKGDVFSSAEGMIPGLDSNWRENGFQGAMQTGFGQIASGFSPLIKSPIEIAMGGGTIYESGYVKPTGSFTESVTSKVASFAGLGTITRASFDALHGNPNEYRSDAAYSVNYWASKMKTDTQQSDGTYNYEKSIQDRVKHMDVDGAGEAIAQYENYLKTNHPEKDASSAIRSAIDYGTLSSEIKRHPEYASGLSQDERDNLQGAMSAQADFLRTIGYGRW